MRFLWRKAPSYYSRSVVYYYQDSRFKKGITMKIKYILLVALAVLALGTVSIQMMAPAIAGGKKGVSPGSTVWGSTPGIGVGDRSGITTAGGAAGGVLGNDVSEPEPTVTTAGSKKSVAPSTLVSDSAPSGGDLGRRIT
jgi:hypothetical protein